MSPTGHFAASFIAKHFAPKINIWILFFISWIQDILFIIFAMLGLEKFGNSISATSSIPAYWSHSLIMSIIYSFIIFFIIKIIYKNNKHSLTAFFLVLSHWILDIIVWPNLPLSPLFISNFLIPGLNLYNLKNDLYKLLIELIIFIPAFISYIYFKKNNKHNKNI